MVENINHRELSDANLQLMHFMKDNRGNASSKTLELEALALELELQFTNL